MQITAENALAVFVKAKSYRMEPLALAAFKIISMNFAQVKQSEEWGKEDVSQLSEMMAQTMAFKNLTKRNKSTNAGYNGFNFFVQF